MLIIRKSPYNKTCNFQPLSHCIFNFSVKPSAYAAKSIPAMINSKWNLLTCLTCCRVEIRSCSSSFSPKFLCKKLWKTPTPKSRLYSSSTRAFSTIIPILAAYFLNFLTINSFLASAITSFDSPKYISI